MVARYGDDAMRFIELFNPGRQDSYTRDIARTYGGKAPQLFAVGEAYGRGTARSWLMLQLRDLSEFAGCREKLPIAKLEELASIIIREYGFLKLTELMDFFRRFKAGSYGKFYGAVDPMVITCALREFMRERSVILSRLEAEDRDARKWKDPDYLDFRRRMARMKERRIYYSRNFYSRDFSFEEFNELWWLFNMGYERDKIKT